ncbi:hypothetical protein [Marinobacter zhanjiangensis]|nr:hypothetical protein [Marinobacter zhanjiangensis]
MPSNNEWPVPKNRMMLGLITNGMILGVGALTHFTYKREIEYWQTQIQEQNELIVFSTQMNSLYFMWVGLLPILLILNIHLLFKDILKCELPRIVLKIQNALVGIMFLGIFLIVAGNWFINPVWEHRFREAGFTECENRVLNIRKALFNDVWVRNPDHCEDPKLRYILHEHFGDEGFELASQYLSALNKQTMDQ